MYWIFLTSGMKFMNPKSVLNLIQVYRVDSNLNPNLMGYKYCIDAWFFKFGSFGSLGPFFLSQFNSLMGILEFFCSFYMKFFEAMPFYSVIFVQLQIQMCILITENRQGHLSGLGWIEIEWYWNLSYLNQVRFLASRTGFLLGLS